MNIEVFCSSEEGSIKVGENFIKTIFEELNSSDIFVPIISSEYYASKFCMIELGVAYSYLYNKYEKNGEEYIFPFVLYPVRKAQALAGTPLSNIQTGDIDNENDIRGFLNLLALKKGLSIGSGSNRKLHAFREKINEILMQKQNIIDMAKINPYFDDSVNYKQKKDIVACSIAERDITEICFVVCPENVSQDNGIFTLFEISIY